MKVDVYDSQGKKTEKSTDLADAVWKSDIKLDLVAQAILIYQHNQRKGTAHSKTRADVSGGGKKPWKQKGTGRARHGSIRSPIWVGGGVTFGPRSYKLVKKMPRKMVLAALRSVLSEKAQSKKVRVVEGFSMGSTPKTKEMVSFVKNIGAEMTKSLLVLSREDKNVDSVAKSARNLQNIRVCYAGDVIVPDVANVSELIVSSQSVKEIESRLTK